MRPVVLFLSMVLAMPMPARAASLSVALLPSGGSASDGDRKATDGALRRALSVADGVLLQVGTDTRRHVLSLAEMGLVCVPDDIQCLVKLGVAADVSLVLVPLVEGSARELDVTIGVVNVGTGAQVRVTRARVALDNDERVRALVAVALGRLAAMPELPVEKPKDPPPRDPPPRDPPPRDPPPQDPPPQDPPPPAAVEPESASYATAGFVVAGISGGVALLGIAGATACELAFAGVVGDADAKTRADVIRPAGVGLWIAGAVGVLGLGSGLLLALLTQEPEAE